MLQVNLIDTCTLLYYFFLFSVQVMLCLHVSCKARTERACNLFYLSMRHHKVSHDIILGAICGVCMCETLSEPHTYLAMFYCKLCLASL